MHVHEDLFPRITRPPAAKSAACLFFQDTTAGAVPDGAERPVPGPKPEDGSPAVEDTGRDFRPVSAVRPATRPGAVMRIADRGLPRYGGRGRGDLNVRVIVDIPRQLSPQQRHLYEQLRALQQAPGQRADPAA